MADSEKQRIDHYILQTEAGRTGSAVLYVARDTRREKDVLLKRFGDSYILTSDYLTRFENEAAFVTNLNHPAIVPIYDYSIVDGMPYVVLEQIRGVSLGDRLTQQQSIHLYETAKIVERIASALDALHSGGFTHGNLNPGEIRFDNASRPYLICPGLMPAAEERLSFEEGDFSAESLPYVSPEQLEEAAMDVRSDVFSLAAIVYHMLTGRPPFSDPSPTILVVKRMTEPVPSIRDSVPDIPVKVDHLLARSLSRRRGERPSTAGEFAALLLEAAPVNGDTLIDDTTRIYAPEEVELSPTMLEPTVNIELPTFIEPLLSEKEHTQISTQQKQISPTGQKERPSRRLGLVLLAGLILTAIVIAALLLAGRENSKSLAVTLEQANTLVENGEFASAITILDELIAAEPDNEQALFLRALSHRKQGDLTSALADFSQAISMEPQNAFNYIGRAETYLILGENENLLADAEMCRTLDPTLVECALLAAAAYRAFGDNNQVLDILEQALALDPQNPAVLGDLAAFYMWDIGDTDQALQYANQAVESAPEDPLLYHFRAVIHRERGEEAEATTDFETFLTLVPVDICLECQEEARQFLESQQ